MPWALRRCGYKTYSFYSFLGAFLSARRFQETAGIENFYDAKVLGVSYVGVPWIKSPFTRKDCLDAITVFNQAGSKLAAHGLKFFYHLHGYEFVPDEGGQGRNEPGPDKAVDLSGRT